MMTRHEEKRASERVESLEEEEKLKERELELSSAGADHANGSTPPSDRM